MKKLTNVLFLALVLCQFANMGVVFGQDDHRKGIAFFESKIRPVLVGHCYRCHSKESNKMRGGLHVDTRDALWKGGDSGPAVVPGKPDESPLYEVLTYKGEYQMPPSGKLEGNMIADFKKWIEMGAPDPRAPKETEPLAAVKSTIDIEAGRNYWAYQSPVEQKIPRSSTDNWSRADLDRFVFDRLKRNGLTPNRTAKPKVLVRRLYFVLTGLPPSPSDLESWSERLTSDDEINLAEAGKLVDQLLESEQFGEHWGRHWMDVARFAESSGGDHNNIHPYAWRYRNYVIDAFNDDKPFDRFIIEQLAGDLLPIKNDEEWANNLIATGFLAIGVKLVGEEDQRKFRADLVDDQIDTTTRAFLATTVSCARCHDHKFDPIPQTDYYALAGIFRSTETHYGLIKAQARQHAKLIDVTELGVPSSKPKLSAKEFAALKKAREDAHARMGELMQNIRGGNAPTRNILRLSRTRRDKAEAALQSYDERGNPRVFVMGTQDHEFPAENHLFVRGEVDKRAQKVDRGFVSVLTPPRRNLLPRNVRGSGRLELAQWIANDENPLTARVIANRIWHWTFGQGIVRTVDDFGATGERPINPDLLDYLARRLVNHDWKVKPLIKEIVLS
ncbi:MAG: PSD1 and planctomycete cytochrome C domain-containing protein, partial [Planctomycetota bacterium]